MTYDDLPQREDPPIEPLSDESGATMLEWALLLGVIAIPSYWIVKLGMNVLIGHYQMITTVNGLPFP